MTIPYKMRELNGNTRTPIDIYQSLTGSKKILLESTFEHEQKGKFSFIGQDPYQEIIGHENTTIVKDHIQCTTEELSINALDFIKKNLPRIDINIPTPFYGGAIGYVGYDAIRQFEHIGENLTDELEMPDIHFMLFKNIIVMDHANKKISIIVTNPNKESETVLNTQLHSLEKTMMNSQKKVDITDSRIHFEPEITQEEFEKRVNIAKKYIKAGDIFQVVLSQRMKANVEGDPFTFYKKLRDANPSPYMFYIDFEDYLILGASPESLVQTMGNQIITNPIAGTRPRGKTVEEDETLKNELLNDKKEIAEHKMLVDLSRNDLGRVCEIGSIEIPTYMTIEKYQHVMHIVSEVKGKLRQDCSSVDALISCLPAGTVSGAPKIRAMQIINELEETKRGPYAGGIGFINFNHDINIALAIRSVVIKDQKAYLQAGAGIVYDSIPEMEYQETLNKAKSLMEVNQIDIVNR